MRTTLSSQMLAAMHAESSGEIVLPLVKLTQVGWEDAICIVPNWETVTHRGISIGPWPSESVCRMRKPKAFRS